MARCLNGFFALSYGDRAKQIVVALEEFLPQEFSDAVAILVARNGIGEPEEALPALYEMTKRFSAEGDIRPFAKANGAQKPKVFRLPEKQLDPGGRLELQKTHKFLPYKNQSFYSGDHELELVINGVSYARASFLLDATAS